MILVLQNINNISKVFYNCLITLYNFESY